jgi:hypothetical protein
MSRARGQPSCSLLDREYPHQVLVPAVIVSGKVVDGVIAFHSKLSIPNKTRSIRKDDEWHKLYCFAAADHAKLFHVMFGGELILAQSKA